MSWDRGHRLVTAAVALAGALLAAAGVRAGEVVSFPSGDETLQGYLALPAGTARAPGLIVIHEWWGLNDQIRGETDRLAALGYAALAVDLYRGRAAGDSEEAHELMRGLPLDRADRDLRAAFAYLRGHSRVAGGKVGSIGWCMGGGYSLRLAQLEPELGAAVVYYGRIATEPDSLAPIRAPVLGLFGAEDRGIPVAQVREFEQRMRAQGKTVEIHIYDGAGHAFANPTRESFRPAAAAEAEQRVRAFLKSKLARD